MSIKAYHYCHISLYRRDTQRDGLKPWLDRWAPWGGNFKPSIYCLLSPTPEEWTQNPRFPEIWDDLALFFSKGRKGLLLELDLNPLRNDAFVGDFSHLASFKGSFLCPSAKPAQEAYLKSRIPLSVYLKNKPGYSLPELVLQKEVLPGDTRVCAEQPMLEKLIGLGGIQPYDLFCLTKMPELEKWRARMQPSQDWSSEGIFGLSRKENKG